MIPQSFSDKDEIYGGSYDADDDNSNISNRFKERGN